MTTEFYKLVLTPGDDLSKFYGWPAEIAKFDEKRLDQAIRHLTLRGVYRYKSTENEHGHDIIEYRGHIIDQSPTGMCEIYRIRPDNTTDLVETIGGRIHAMRYVNNAVYKDAAHGIMPVINRDIILERRYRTVYCANDPHRPQHAIKSYHVDHLYIHDSSIDANFIFNPTYTVLGTFPIDINHKHPGAMTITYRGCTITNNDNESEWMIEGNGHIDTSDLRLAIHSLDSALTYIDEKFYDKSVGENND